MSNSKLLDEVFLAVEAIGIDKTIEALKRVQFQEVVIDDKRVKTVLDIISEKLNVPIYEILYGNGRKNERKMAIGFCAYYLHSSEFYGIDMSVVKDHLKRDLITCYQHSKLITKLKPSLVSDKHFFDIKMFVDDYLTKKIVKEHKK